LLPLLADPTANLRRNPAGRSAPLALLRLHQMLARHPTCSKPCCLPARAGGRPSALQQQLISRALHYATACCAVALTVEPRLGPTSGFLAGAGAAAASSARTTREAREGAWPAGGLAASGHSKKGLEGRWRSLLAAAQLLALPGSPLRLNPASLSNARRQGCCARAATAGGGDSLRACCGRAARALLKVHREAMAAGGAARAEGGMRHS